MSNKQKADHENAAPLSSGSHGASEVDRHRDRVVAAETRRLQRELRAIGPMPREKLAELCHADRWSEGSLDEAVRAGVRAGKLRELPLGWVAAGTHGADSTSAESA